MPEPVPPISRRSALKGAAAAAAVAVAGAMTATHPANAGPTVRRSRKAWPAIVVGSGYGGAVSALHLTRHGIPTLMLEMGREWPRPTRPFFPIITPGDSSLWLKHKTILPFGPRLPAPYTTGVLDRLTFPHMEVYCGRGVGGSSLVNGGISVEPRRAFLRSIMPMLDIDRMYREYYPRARRRLHVNTIDRAFHRTTPWYEFSRRAVEQAHQADYRTLLVSNVYDFDFLVGEATVPGHPRSALAGELILGNNYGKRSVDTSYIRRARRTGHLTVRALRHVVDIRRTRTGQFELTVHRLDRQGEVADVETYLTDHLFLNGGSIGTTEMLLGAAHRGHLDLPDDVGRGWGNNGNIQSGRLISAETGASQSTVVTNLIDGWNDERPILGEIAPLPTGTENHTSLYLGVTPLETRGRLVWDDQRNRATLRWPADGVEPSIAAMRDMVDRINAAAGGTYAYDLFPSGFGSGWTYHPLGGALLGHVTDNYGRVRGNPGLYVMDGSLIHGVLGANPLLTITALAERNMDEIMAADFRTRSARGRG